MLRKAMSLLRVYETLISARRGQTSEEEGMAEALTWAGRLGPEQGRRLDMPPRGGEVRRGDE